MIIGSLPLWLCHCVACLHTYHSILQGPRANIIGSAVGIPTKARLSFVCLCTATGSCKGTYDGYLKWQVTIGVAKKKQDKGMKGRGIPDCSLYTRAENNHQSVPLYFPGVFLNDKKKCA